MAYSLLIQGREGLIDVFGAFSALVALVLTACIRRVLYPLEGCPARLTIENLFGYLK